MVFNDALYMLHAALPWFVIDVHCMVVLVTVFVSVFLKYFCPVHFQCYSAVMLPYVFLFVSNEQI